MREAACKNSGDDLRIFDSDMQAALRELVEMIWMHDNETRDLLLAITELKL
jgi:hypothetical protein